MLILKTIQNARFNYLVLIGALILGAVGVAVAWYVQPVPSQEPELIKLIAKNKDLNHSLAQSAMTLDIERKTVNEMNNTLLSLQAESLEQQLALRFYQKVMAPEYTANGVHIEKVRLEAGISEHHIRVEVLIAQLEKRKRYIKGKLWLKVIGSRNGKPEVLNINSMVKSSKDFKVSFRFFQHIKSEFVLPKNFLPERVKVSIQMPRQKGQKYANISQEYTWNELIMSASTPMLPTS